MVVCDQCEDVKMEHLSSAASGTLAVVLSFSDRFEFVICLIIESLQSQLSRFPHGEISKIRAIEETMRKRIPKAEPLHECYRCRESDWCET